MYCDVDVIVPEAVIQYMAKKIPQTQMIKLNATGHYPHVSSPEVVSQAIMSNI